MKVSEKKLEITTISLFLLGITIFILGLFMFSWNEYETLTINQIIKSDKIGQFGDFIGGIVGSLWALAGVILFYLALKEQRKDIQINQQTLKTQVTALNHQIEEFKLQTEELAETRKVFKEQGETLRIQRFENTFFQLLQLHHELIDKLRMEIDFGYFGEAHKFEERDVFLESTKVLKTLLPKTTYKVPDSFEIMDIDKEISSIDEAYNQLILKYKEFYYVQTKQILSNYYRNIYHIYKFIRYSNLIDVGSKQFYASIVRAQLSSDELYLILYNSLIPGLGKPKFLSLVKEFKIMKNFDFGLIAEYKYHKDIFDQEIDEIE